MNVTQASFADALLDPARPVPAGLTDGTGQPTLKRYDVYRNNVAVSLTEALIAAFPVVCKLVGDAFFRAMAGVYLRTHQPSTPLMMYYGDKMPTFLRRFGPAQRLAYLPDVAALEIALRESYHAADAAPITPQTLGDMPTDTLMGAGLTFAPALRLLRSAHPVHGIWRANMDAGAPAPAKRPENVLVTRPGFDPVQHPVSDAAADLIAALQAGTSLGAALTRAPQADLGKVLGLLLRQNAIVAIN